MFTQIADKDQMTPCLACKRRSTCKKMCKRRLEWGVLKADIDNPYLKTYGLSHVVGEGKNKNKSKNKSKTSSKVYSDYVMERIIKENL